MKRYFLSKGLLAAAAVALISFAAGIVVATVHEFDKDLDAGHLLSFAG